MEKLNEIADYLFNKIKNEEITHEIRNEFDLTTEEYAYIYRRIERMIELVNNRKLELYLNLSLVKFYLFYNFK